MALFKTKQPTELEQASAAAGAAQKTLSDATARVRAESERLALAAQELVGATRKIKDAPLGAGLDELVAARGVAANLAAAYEARLEGAQEAEIAAKGEAQKAAVVCVRLASAARKAEMEAEGAALAKELHLAEAAARARLKRIHFLRDEASALEAEAFQLLGTRPPPAWDRASYYGSWWVQVGPAEHVVNLFESLGHGLEAHDAEHGHA